MQKAIRVLLATSILSAGLITRAEPTLYPNDLNVLSSIKNSTDSNIIADEKDPKTVWVLPPNTAQAEVSGLHTPLANMIFCKDLVKARNYAAAQADRIEKVASDLEANRGDILALENRASDLSIQAERYSAENGLRDLQIYDDRIANAELRLSKLYEAYDKCKEDCYGIKTEIGTTNEEKRQAMQARSTFLEKNNKDLREYKRRRAEADAAKKKVDDKRAAYDQLFATFLRLRDLFLSQFASFAALPGAKANITYTSHWSNNIDKLRSENPGFNFPKVATKNAKLMGELSGVGGMDPQGAIQYISYGGEDFKGIVPFPNYPEALSSNISLTLLGACPMVHPKEFDVEGIADAQKMKYGVIITYDYDSIFTAKGMAVYNMYKMYQKIVSSGSSGGLFSSRSWSSVEEKNFFRDSFSVVWDDKEGVIPQELKDERETEMRRNILTRLATLALPAVPNRAEILPQAQAPTRGAIVASEEIAKACPYNAYCVGTAAVLRVLDAIFGSSSSSSSYTQITDTEVKDNYAQTQKITKSWITTYIHPKQTSNKLILR